MLQRFQLSLPPLTSPPAPPTFTKGPLEFGNVLGLEPQLVHHQLFRIVLRRIESILPWVWVPERAS